MKNNLCNLGIEDTVKNIVEKYGINLEEIYEYEPDAGLGNGGLGRLAACFLDSLTTMNYPATGFSILYEYGFFRQKLIDCEQVELSDEWMPRGSMWLVPRTDKSCIVKLGGHITENWNSDGRCEIIHTDAEEIRAVPYDLMISGKDTDAVNVLRLWRARGTADFNMSLFSQGQYVKAIEEKNNADVISKVLYPADNHNEGKLLRLNQQYFLVSASVNSIISDHLSRFGTLESFADKVAIHINDTHPALVIPELMRVFIDIYSYSWEDAWDTVNKTVTYTNHTVMPEALECWSEDLFKLRLPRIYMIVQEMNKRICADLWNLYPGDWMRISDMSLIDSGKIKMANICVCASNKVNGVSQLHSEILKKSVFHNYYKYTPFKFTNVTNGISHRRWLCNSNQLLCDLLDNTIGSEYRQSPEKLIDFIAFSKNRNVLEELEEIKLKNKISFSEWVFKNQGKKVNPESVFDVHIKRMHEYKRQLMNVLRIISIYCDLMDNPNLDLIPRTFIFSAKAAPGYYEAKQIIRLISSIENELKKHPVIREKLNVIFVENYNVSVAEMLIPAAEISEQISLAGKEASGTGNMKLMINGALTIGTLDGANIEICNSVGRENFYLFGHTTDEVDELWKQGYRSSKYSNGCIKLKHALDCLNIGFNGNSFAHITDYLLSHRPIPDPFMCIADFDSYYRVHEKMDSDYKDRVKWNTESAINIANAGRFSADNSIKEYSEKIWHIKPVEVTDEIQKKT